MKRKFLIEVEYNELEENISNMCPVLQEEAINISMENLLEGYKETNSIVGNFSVSVKEVVD